MATTGFLLVDGSDALRRAPAAPRHWSAALLIVIVAQWLMWQGYALCQLIALSWISRSTIGATEASMTAAGVLATLLYLLVPTGLLALIALYLSRRLDRRSARALGLDLMTIPTAAVWTIAGLIAATPLIVAIIANQAEPGAVARGLAVLTPITIVQAGSEEILFRGVVLASLAARYGVRTGLLISAVLFGLWHVSIGQSSVDAAVMFGATFVFGLTAGVLTLHYGNLGPALALHVVWNVAGYLKSASAAWEMDFWLAWLNAFDHQWAYDDLINGELTKFVFIPLALETLLVLVACRATVGRLFSPPRLTVSPGSSTSPSTS